MTTTTQLGLHYLSTLAPWDGVRRFDLSRIAEVLKRLGDPQDRLPSMHIAGTNGKGSVSVTSAAILGAAGYRVGLNVSPHLFRQNERLVVDGIPVSDEFLAEFALAVRSASARAFLEPTFHEALTALGFLGFLESGMEWVVMEVGLGGRLDASNVLKRPKVASIVSIGLDHQNILGDSIEMIAKEKAGIAKRGVPLVVGPVAGSASKIISGEAARAGALLCQFGREFESSVNAARPGTCSFSCRVPGFDVTSAPFTPALRGNHQVANMGVAIMNGLLSGVPLVSCIEGTEQVFWPGRLEELDYAGSRIWLDCAHNPDGLRSLTSFLDSSCISRVEFAIGVLDTKNWGEMIDIIAPYAKNVCVLEPDSSRAVPVSQLAEQLSSLGVRHRLFGRDYSGFIRELSNRDTGCPIVICGSIYLVGRLRAMLVSTDRPLWNRKKASGTGE